MEEIQFLIKLINKTKLKFTESFSVSTQTCDYHKFKEIENAYKN